MKRALIAFFVMSVSFFSGLKLFASQGKLERRRESLTSYIALLDLMKKHTYTDFKNFEANVRGKLEGPFQRQLNDVYNAILKYYRELDKIKLTGPFPMSPIAKIQAYWLEAQLELSELALKIDLNANTKSNFPDLKNTDCTD